MIKRQKQIFIVESLFEHKKYQNGSLLGIDAQSSSFYLRAKGELVETLKALAFERLSIFEPSMILTPTNRYGIKPSH